MASIRIRPAFVLAPVLALQLAFVFAEDLLEGSASAALPVVIEPLSPNANAAEYRVLIRRLKSDWFDSRYRIQTPPAPGEIARIEGTWVNGLRIVGSPEAILRSEGFRVRIGDREFPLALRDLAESRIPESEAASMGIAAGLEMPIGGFEIPATVCGRESSIPGLTGVRNWPGLGPVLGELASRHLSAVVAFVALVVLGMAARRRQFGDWYLRLPAKPALPAGRFWDVLGWATVLAAFVGLELRQPHYFAQDDVLAAELPLYVTGLRALWAGTIPEYNPWLYLGGPLGSLGMFQLSYPPMWMSYGIARHVLGNEWLLPEVYAFLHLLAGYAVTRRLAGEVGMSRPVAVLAALSFVLSGSILLMGRGWCGFMANAVWLPALMLSLHRMSTGQVGWRWTLATGAAIGLYFHTGFTQNPAFACGFFSVGVLFLAGSGTIPWRRAALAIPAIGLGAAAAAPLLVQQYLAHDSAGRGDSSTGDVAGFLSAFLLPYPLSVPFAKSTNLHPANWGNAHLERMGHLAFSGGLLAAATLAEGLALLTRRGPRPPGSRVWLALAALAFCLTLGKYGAIWQLGGSVPVIGSLFRYPFRLLPELALFTSLAGGLALDRVLARREPRARTIACSLGIAVLGYHVAQLTPAFYTYGFEPYPNLPEPVRALAGTHRGRVLSVAPVRDGSDTHPFALPYNLPAVYGIPAVDGYSPLNDNRTFRNAYNRMADSTAACRAYGLRWVLLSGAAGSEPETSPPFPPYVNQAIWQKIRGELRPSASFPGGTLLELSGSAPLAFSTARPETPLPIRIDTSGIDVDTSNIPAGSTVVVNFLWSPAIHATANGEAIQSRGDDWNRITVTLAQTADRLEVRYRSNWWPGWWLSVGLTISSALMLTGLVGRGELP